LEYELLDAHIFKLERDIEEKKQEQTEVEGEIKKFEVRQKELITQKASLNIDNQVLLLKKDILLETSDRDRKRQDAESYERLATALGLQKDISETSFKENQKKVDELQVSTETEHERLSDQKFSINTEKQKLTIRIGDTQDEITSLLSRKNRLPQDLIRVRERTVGAIGNWGRRTAICRRADKS